MKFIHSHAEEFVALVGARQCQRSACSHDINTGFQESCDSPGRGRLCYSLDRRGSLFVGGSSFLCWAVNTLMGLTCLQTASFFLVARPACYKGRMYFSGRHSKLEVVFEEEGPALQAQGISKQAIAMDATPAKDEEALLPIVKQNACKTPPQDQEKDEWLSKAVKRASPAQEKPKSEY